MVPAVSFRCNGTEVVAWRKQKRQALTFCCEAFRNECSLVDKMDEKTWNNISSDSDVCCDVCVVMSVI